MSRTPLTWLVIATVDDANGLPVVLLGRASYDGDADLLTVTTIGQNQRHAESTQGGRMDLQALARMLLVGMHRDGRVRG